jgi:hypothetical protein
MMELPQGTDGLQPVAMVPRRWALAAVVIIFSIVLATLGLRVCTARLLLTAKAESVTLSVDREVTIQPGADMAGTSFELSSVGMLLGLHHSNVQGIHHACTLSGAGRIELRSISLDRNAQLTIRAERSAGLVLVLQGNGGIELQLSGARDILVVGCGMADAWHLPVEGATSFRAAPRSQAAPLVLRLLGNADSAAFSVSDPVEVAGLGFTVARSAQTDLERFRSSILSGSLRLKGVPHEFELRPAEPLRLTSFQGHITSLHATQTDVRASVLGGATSVSVGPRGFEEELKPSLFIYAKSLHLLELVSSAWGILLISLVVLGIWKRTPHDQNAKSNMPPSAGSDPPLPVPGPPSLRG